MTYHRDGSLCRIGPRSAHRRILLCGWLTAQVSFPTSAKAADAAQWSKSAADRSRVRMMRGHHVCELCQWEDANYGNGEIWMKLGAYYYRMPRMVWHYQEAHQYALPDTVVTALATGSGVLCTDQEASAQLATVDPRDVMSIPAVRYQALWKEGRYRDLTEFSRQLSQRWNSGPCFVRDGYYCMGGQHLPMHDLRILFEMDPENFPDHITIDRDDAGA